MRGHKTSALIGLQLGHVLSDVETSGYDCSDKAFFTRRFNWATSCQTWKRRPRAVPLWRTYHAVFNWATSRQTWKRRRQPRGIRTRCCASIGPRPVGRGNCHVLSGSSESSLLAFASIGPRPVRRGKTLSTVHGQARHAVLQLGHVPSDVETLVRASFVPLCASCFNWATSCQTWKRDWLVLPRYRSPVASIGLCPVRRGNHLPEAMANRT